MTLYTMDNIFLKFNVRCCINLTPKDVCVGGVGVGVRVGPATPPSDKNKLGRLESTFCLSGDCTFEILFVLENSCNVHGHC